MKTLLCGGKRDGGRGSSGIWKIVRTFGKILATPLQDTPKKHTSRLRVHERVAISLAEVCERVGKFVIAACKRT